MKQKIIPFVVLIGCVVGVTFFISKLRGGDKTLEEKGLVVVGKAPKFSFTNQNGETITDQTYKGKVYVVDFFFTTCPTICPVMTANMTLVQNAFPDNSIGIASFSINPETDTPQVLKTYAEQKGVTNPNWHFLTGDEDEIYKLSNEGFNIYAGKGNAEEGGFEHSGLFALIDQNGNIVCRKNDKGQPIIYYQGLDNKEIANLVEDIKKLQN